MGLKEQKAQLRQELENQRAFEELAASALGYNKSKTLLMLLREKSYRKLRGMTLYTPQPRQKEFHSSNAPERLALGANRGMKTTCCAAELAWAVTGTHPFLDYPLTDGRAICVAKDQTKIGEVMFHKLFKRGAYRIVFDKETGYWRGWEPWRDGYDRRKTLPSLPLIPREMIKKIAWEKKALNCPKLVQLTNGWEISFFTSAGKPIEGVDVDVCLAGWSRVYDPVERCHRRIDEIEGRFHVYSYNPKTGRIEVRDASKPYVKGHGEIVKVALSNGHDIFTTRKHRIMAIDGRWLSIQDAFDSGVKLARALSFHAVQSAGVSARRSPSTHQTSSPTLSAETCWQGHGSSLCPEMQMDSWLAERPSTFRVFGEGFRVQPVRSEPASQTLRACGPEQATQAMYSPAEDSLSGCGGICQQTQSLQLSGVCREHKRRTHERFGEQFSGNSRILRPFCGCRETCISLQTHAVASASEDCPLVFCESTRASLLSAPQDSQSSCSGGFRPCGEPPPFSGAACQGAAPLQGGALESCRPSMRQGDPASTRRCIPSRSRVDTQALVPASGSFLSILSIESVGEYPIWDINVPETNNYVYRETISHNCWFDEEIYESQWYAEMAARLVDRNGRFFWSATPQLATDQLWALHEEAMKQKGMPNPRIEEFHFLLDDNPYIQKEQKDLLKAKYANNPEQYRVRILGQFLVASHRVYPNFNLATHCCEAFPIPNHWTRYLGIDPGFANSVALFVAVPPPSESKHIYIYDELYCHGKDVKAFAEMLEPKTRGQNFEAFIIDAHGSRKTEVGTGKTIAQHYADAFKAKGIKSSLTANGFIPVGEDGHQGSSPLIAGVHEVREWLWNQDDGKPILQVFSAYCPEFCDEMRFYKNVVDKKTGKATDKPDSSKYSHGPDVLRYFKVHGIPYAAPRKPKPEASAVVRYFRDKMKRKNREGGTDKVYL